MAFYGDSGPKRFYAARPQWSGIKMSTAIVRVLTSEGFVIAADGRQTTDNDTKVVTDLAQKIFPVCDESRQLSCAMCGTTSITADDGEMVWNLSREIPNAIGSLSTRKSRDLAGYALRLCRPINAILEQAKRNGKIAEYPTPKAMMKERGSRIAAILIDGYYRRVPSRVQARFFHENQKLCEPEIVSETPILDRYDAIGSDKILNVFFDSEDPRLSKYGKPRGIVVSSIENAIRLAHGYITACSSPEGLLIDNECPGIGGHIHVATITPDEGFGWTPGYEPHGMI